MLMAYRGALKHKFKAPFPWTRVGTAGIRTKVRPNTVEDHGVYIFVHEFGWHNMLLGARFVRTSQPITRLKANNSANPKASGKG